MSACAELIAPYRLLKQNPKRVKAREQQRPHGTNAKRQVAAMHAQTDTLPESGTPVEVLQSVTEGADSRYVWQNSKPVVMRIYEREIQILPNVPPRKTGSTPVRRKGDIQRFSKSSRLRLMRKLNRVQSQLLTTPLFITLTHRHGSHTVEQFQYAFRKKFLPALKEIIPECCFIWRLEPHRNGKPHYHLIVWSFRKKITIESEFYLRKIRQAWRESIDQHDRAAQLYSCKIEPLGSHKKVMSYVSKYVAKEDDEVGSQIEGRRWASSSNLPAGPITEVNLTRSQLEQVKQIVSVIMRAQNKPQGLIDTVLANDLMMWVWLEPHQIQEVLDFLGIPPPANQYSRYRKSGYILPSMEELSNIAADYGYDF